MATTDLSTLAAEYADALSAELLLAPDAELVLARHAYAAAMAAEMAAASPAEFDIVAAQMASLASAKTGVAANMVQAMAGGGEGSLDLSQGFVFPGLVQMVKEAKEQGDTIKINRPKYLDDVIGAGRILKPTSLMFGSSQPLGMDQVSVTVVESSGPGDASGNTVPVGIALFAQERARHDQLTNAKLQLRRSRYRWVHHNLQNAILAVTNITRPSGVSSLAAFTGADNEPLTYETLARVEEKLQGRNIPGVSGSPVYPLYVSPTGLRQLKNDPAYQRQAEFHEGFNLLFPGYIKNVGNLAVCLNNTIPTKLGGASSDVTVRRAYVVAPQAMGWGLGSDAVLLRDKNDDGGRFLKVGWRAVEGFQLLNSDFVEVIEHS